MSEKRNLLNRQEINRLELELSRGNHDQVRSIIQKIQPHHLRSEDQEPFAALCRKAGLPWFTLLTLYPALSGQKAQPLSNHAKFEYAAALLKIGVHREAQIRLKDLVSRGHQEALSLLALSYISSWHHDKAIEPLRSYLSSPHLEDHQRTIAMINLSAAQLGAGQNEEAGETLHKLRLDNNEKKLKTPYIHTLELSGQLELERKNYDKAEEYLNTALQLLPSSTSHYSTLLNKWLTITQLTRHGPFRRGLVQLKKVQDEALNKGLWETARECDFFHAQIFNRPELYFKVFFGTPNHQRRQQFQARWTRDSNLPTEYDWHLNETRGLHGFDLVTAAEIKGEARLKKDDPMYQLFALLCSDFYKPPSAGAIYNALFSSCPYAPLEAKEKVNGVIENLKTWFDQHHLPLTVSCAQQVYRLHNEAPYFLRVGQPNTDASAELLKAG